VHVEDAELLTDWQRKQAEFKQRRAISGAEGAKAKQERMKQFQQRLRGAAAAEKPAVKPDAEPTPEVSLYTRSSQGRINTELKHCLPLTAAAEKPAATPGRVHAHLE